VRPTTKLAGKPRWALVVAACGSLLAVAVPGQETMESALMKRASGAFDVKVTPQANDTAAEGSALGRLSLDKQYHGELEATGKGEMLTAETGVEGSGAYVAVERVSGTLHGRRGTFALQHSGTMSRGGTQLSITIVPDSGTGELAGISGKLGIRFGDGGAHFYDLDYELP
jgi:hypothetical protein